MIGIIPSAQSTFEVYGDFNAKPLIEGKLYYRPSDKRLFYYSKIETRTSPKTGYFPIWDGVHESQSLFANVKYFDKDVITPDVAQLSSTINSTKAKEIVRNQRLSENRTKLQPKINDADNMFTQIIKSVINVMGLTKLELIDKANGYLDENMVENYYASLSKVTMMRLEKFHIWMDKIFHVGYRIIITKDDKEILVYQWPQDIFQTGLVKYDDITKKNDDPYKKIMKILMVKENISKADLHSDVTDDYTVNNMMTTLNGSKSMSAQIFCRFIRLTNLSLTVEVIDNDKTIFTYKE